MSDTRILMDDDKPLELENKQTLVVNWIDDMNKEIYDENAEKEYEVHESCTKEESGDSSQEEAQKEE